MPLQNRPVLLVLMVTMLLVLVNCGGASSQASSARMTPAPAVRTPAEVAATVPPEGGASLFASLPQSRTAEGYYVLGRSDAPILMEFFSDFL